MISLVQGDEARGLLRESRFLEEWNQLADRCPWATAFQSSSFAAAWYESYDTQYRPLLVLSHDANALEGVIALATSRADSSKILAVGDGQAEYQAWIGLPHNANDFPLQAIQLLQKSFPKSTLTLRYLPSGTPLDWLRNAGDLPPHVKEVKSRPMISVSRREVFSDFLRNKTTRNQLNRLNAIGPLKLTRIATPSEVERLLDTLIDYYDVRQAAVHGVAPFAEDDLKLPFHLRMAKANGLLHATALTAGPHLVAGHLGVAGKQLVHLGILAYDPLLAKYSPGKFLLYYLAELLQSEGYNELDLTPGGDQYKERYADSHDQVHTLTLFFSRPAYACWSVRSQVVKSTKSFAKLLGIGSGALQSLRKSIGESPSQAAVNMAQATKELAYSRLEMHVYATDLDEIDPLEPVDPHIHRDYLKHLLKVSCGQGASIRSKYLSAALTRMSGEHHFYSGSEHSGLTHWGWLGGIEKQMHLAEMGIDLSLTADRVCLYDMHSSSQTPEGGVFKSLLMRMLREAAQMPGVKKALCLTLQPDGFVTKALEGVGLKYEGMLVREVKLGRVRHYSRGLPPDWWSVPSRGRVEAQLVSEGSSKASSNGLPAICGVPKTYRSDAERAKRDLIRDQ